MIAINTRTGLIALSLAVLLYLLVVHSGSLRMGGYIQLTDTPRNLLDIKGSNIDMSRSNIDMSRVLNRQAPNDSNNKLNYKSKSPKHIFTAKDIAEKPKGKLVEDVQISHPVTFWSNDFHIGPIQDLKDLLRPLGVKFIDKSLSGHCHLTKTCARGLRVVNQRNGINLNPGLINSFYDVYKDDAEMKSVDAFVCFHPSSMCELFMPFNKSLVVIASTRYEMGRHDPNRWKSWNQNLIKISKDPKNTVAANNEYDAKYIEYFTGIKAQVLPSYCGYIPESYNPSRPEFLLTPVHQGQFEAIFLDQFKQSKYTKSSKVELVPLRQKYAHYEYSDLTAHKGLVYVPYQVSVMSLFEQYRMNIPLFFPTLDLLTDWQFQYHVMNERTWSQLFGRIPGGSPLQGVKEGIPDPNDERSKEALKYWIKYADFYKFPHIILYSSTDDLVFKMETTDLMDVSNKMKKYNAEFKQELLDKWKNILENIYRRSANHQ